MQEERDPERAVGAERDRPERVPGPELPDPRDELGDAPVGERERGHHRQQTAADQTAVADQAGVDHAEHEGGPGERGETERTRIGRRPAGHPSAHGLGGRRHVGLAPSDVCGFHRILLMRG